MRNALPVIAITMGDAAGIGAEVIAKALETEALYEFCRPVVVGDLARIVDASLRCGVVHRVVEVVEDDLPELHTEPDVVPVIQVGTLPDDLPFGRLSAIAGEAAYQYVCKASQLAVEQRVAGICTAPLNKAALHAAGHNFPGHTELLAYLTQTEEVSMMLTNESLSVIHVTTHLGLIDAVERIDAGLVQRTIERGHRVMLKKLVGSAPRLAVCGINPHAGENGLFGRGEEEEKIAPAVDHAREAGIDVVGPLPADAVFFRAMRGDFDLVVAMYHDQGHCPVKVLGIDSGVNVTVGLPVVRTSVEHGTAFDIAGTGSASAASMIQALVQAGLLAGQGAG